MPIMVKADSGGAGTQAPEGVHRAVCVGVYDVGTQPSFDPKYKPKRRVVLVWELPDELLPDGRPFVVSAEYTQSLHEMARLRNVLETWRGRPFTDPELNGFDLIDLLGKPCQLQVQTNERGYANVAAVIRFAKGMQPIKETHNPLTHFGLDEQRRPVMFPDAMPEWIRKKVRQSPEYTAIDLADVEDVEDDDDLAEADDDIPF